MFQYGTRYLGRVVGYDISIALTTGGSQGAFAYPLNRNNTL